jgi:glutamate:GABA antiporter
MNNSTSKIKINAFQLAMITVAYIASVRVLPTMAMYGFSCLFYYLLGAFTFLVPAALISAELATALPARGGIYVWVREALGGHMGFLAIWLQFLSNIVSLPAFLSFLVATGAYIFMPQLADNKYFLIICILIIFWGSTFVSFFGMRTASWLNTFGAFVGTFIPTIIILIMGAVWLLIGNQSQIVFSVHTFFPHLAHVKFNDLAFLAGILFSLTGMEVSGSHAEDVKDVNKNYSKGIFLAALLVVLVGFGAISIAIVVPQKDLSLVSGIMQAFTVFFNQFHMHWAVSTIAAFILIGGIAALNSSIIGPSKGIFGSATGGEIPPLLSKTNKYGMPVNMFIAQGIGVSIITSLFLFMPSVNSSYWLIMAIVTTLYLVMYLLLFISGIVLRYKRADLNRTYKVPGGKLGMWIVASAGIISTTFGMIISFFPPSQITMGSTDHFELLLISGIIILGGVGFLLYAIRKPEWVVNVDKDLEQDN